MNIESLKKLFPDGKIHLDQVDFRKMLYGDMTDYEINKQRKEMRESREMAEKIRILIEQTSN